MKFIFPLILTFFVSAMSNAQTAGELRLSGGLALGTEAGLDDNGGRALGLGINIGAEYFVVERISASPSFTYFFKSTIGTSPNEASLTLNSVNLDGRYYFMDTPVELYGIAGIAIASATVESSINTFGVVRDFEDTDTEVGINFGAGTNLHISDDLEGNVQLIYNTPLEQPIFNFGVAYRIM